MDDLRCASVKAVQSAGHARAAMTLDVYSGGPFDDDLDGVAEQSNQALPAEWYASGAAEPRTVVIELRSGV